LPKNKAAQRTEIWSGLETISKKSFQVLSRAKATSDYCHDSKSPFFLVTNDQYFQMIKQLKAKGIRQRFITEITQENVRYSKELANYVELRHLEGVKGNFGIVDGKEYGAAANIYDCSHRSNLFIAMLRHLLSNSSTSLKFCGIKQYPLNRE